MSDYPEQCVIAAYLSEPTRAKQTGLLPTDFSVPAYAHIADLCLKHDSLDMFGIAEKLVGKVADPQVFVMDLVAETSGSTHWARYAEEVRKASNCRSAQKRAMKLVEELREGSDGAIERAIKDLNNLLAGEVSASETIDRGVDLANEQIQARADGKHGIRTGFARLDRHLGGMHEGDLVTIGARPAMGKTALVVNMALRCSVPSGMISTEQGLAQIGERAMAFTGMTSVSEIRSGRCTQDQVSQARAQIGSLPFHIYDHSSPTIPMVQRQCRAWAQNDGVKIVFVDYLQRLMGDKTLKRHESVGEIARALKTLARDLNITVVALAQLNRQFDRADRQPCMADLKDSGDIEQESDLIMLMHNPDEILPGAQRWPVDLILAKNRHGGTGIFPLVFEASRMRFTDG